VRIVEIEVVARQRLLQPHGEVVVSGLDFRNSFHFHPLCKADLFVPCGGRPESVKLADVHNLFEEDGKTPKFRFIVEGANLFFSHDARTVLEQKGVALFKDASTNKGGVTSSSLEVLAALTLNDAEFKEHMSVQDIKHPPAFYSAYVKQICARIEADAGLEFEVVYRENKRTGINRHTLTDIVSDKINKLVAAINRSALYDDVKLRRNVLAKVIPSTLVNLVGLDNVLVRVPDSYLRATFSTYIASRYVYQFGIDSNEFTFYDFMAQLKG